MSKPLLPLTALSEVQRAQDQERFEIIRPALEESVTQAQLARTHQIPASTIQLWIKRYREQGLAGLAHAAHSDKGKPRRLPTDTVGLIEGLALQTPPRSQAGLHALGSWGLPPANQKTEGTHAETTRTRGDVDPREYFLRALEAGAKGVAVSTR